MAVLDSIKGDLFIKEIGLEFLELDKEHGIARFPFKKELLNPYGTVHGGVLYSVGDIVCGSVACMCDNFCTTVSGNMEYISPGVAKEYLECRATLKRSGAHMVFVTGEIYSDSGKLVSICTYTFYRTDVKA